MRRTRDSGRDNDSAPATPDQQARAAAIAAEITARLAGTAFALPGTLADRMTRCGHPNCRCHADPPQLHGPYHQWTRKKNGKTATRILTDEQAADYGPWFDNHRRLRELITELEELSLDITENDPRRTATRNPRSARQNPNSSSRTVGQARLTCGQPSTRPPFPQVNPKREDLTNSL